jgi:hypothetical protein
MDKQFADSEHKTKMQQIDEEAREKFKAVEQAKFELDKSGLDGIRRAKDLIKIQEDGEKILFERRKKAIEENGRFARDWNKILMDDARQAEILKFQAEKDRIEKVKALNDQQMAKFNPQKLLEATDPDKVFKAFQNNRAEAAQKAQAERDRDLYEDGVGGDKNAMRKYASNQKRAMQQARNKATEDAENGTVGEGELQQAQGNVAEQTLKTLQSQGKLNTDQVTAMTNAIKTLSDQQMAIDNMANMMENIIAFQKGQKNGAQQTRNAVRDQQGSLN